MITDSSGIEVGFCAGVLAFYPGVYSLIDRLTEVRSPAGFRNKLGGNAGSRSSRHLLQERREVGAMRTQHAQREHLEPRASLFTMEPFRTGASLP